MCTTLILANGRWVGSIAEMREEGFTNLDTIQRYEDHQDTDCFCGVDLDDYLAADESNWVFEDAGFWIEMTTQ